MEKSCRNMHQMLGPDPFFIFVNNPKKPLHARIFLKIRYLERGWSKIFKKVNFIFSFQPSPF